MNQPDSHGQQTRMVWTMRIRQLAQIRNHHRGNRAVELNAVHKFIYSMIEPLPRPADEDHHRTQARRRTARIDTRDIPQVAEIERRTIMTNEPTFYNPKTGKLCIACRRVQQSGRDALRSHRQFGWRWYADELSKK